MPYIDFKVSTELSSEKEALLKTELGKIITEIPGKTESRLMVEFSDNCRLWYAGTNDEASAFVNVMLYGSASEEAYKSLADKTIELISSELSIPKNRIYLKFEEVSNWFWG